MPILNMSTNFELLRIIFKLSTIHYFFYAIIIYSGLCENLRQTIPFTCAAKKKNIKKILRIVSRRVALFKPLFQTRQHKLIRIFSPNFVKDYLVGRFLRSRLCSILDEEPSVQHLRRYLIENLKTRRTFDFESQRCF